MSKYINPNLLLETHKITPGSVAWQSPSNLALVKYWGKYGDQLPSNPSLSFTLSSAYTKTRISYKARKTSSTESPVAFYFEEKRNAEFEKRIVGYLSRLEPIFPFLKQLDLKIDSQNSFPHSSGIASSASAMSALALCICELEQLFFNNHDSRDTFIEKASYVARLGSGSASRSVFPKSAVWGKMEGLPESSDTTAIGFAGRLHDVFHDYCNDIVIVSDAPKGVSSSQGHALMEHNPYASVRFVEAKNNLRKLIGILKNGDLQQFVKIVELEALHLHALMMVSNPYYILMHPGTIAVIKAIWRFREQTNIPVCFSLDAGTKCACTLSRRT